MTTPSRQPLPRRFCARSAPEVAQDLVGAILWAEVSGRLVAGRIVETEAYLGQGQDPASHAHGGPTPRSRVMFGPAGVVYVYFIYGMHHCFNLVTGRRGEGGAVLVRACEPLVGVEVMRQRRLRPDPDHRLCAGPGRLCQALGFDLSWNGLPLGISRKRDVNKLVGGRVWLSAGQPARTVVPTTRVGIRQARDRQLRFCDPESPALSRPIDPEG